MVRVRGWVVGGGPPGVEADRVRVYVLAGVPDCGRGGVFELQERVDRSSAISRVAAMAICGLTCAAMAIRGPAYLLKLGLLVGGRWAVGLG
jgi:hypothetical protein